MRGATLFAALRFGDSGCVRRHAAIAISAIAIHFLTYCPAFFCVAVVAVAGAAGVIVGGAATPMRVS